MKRKERKFGEVAALVFCLLSFVAAADEALPAASADLPPLVEPVALVDSDGNAETGLVDPFRRRGEEGGSVGSEPGEDGLMRTTMGEISSEFRILAITIPEDTNTPRSALIQFYMSDEPILVHEGDLVRVDRTGGLNKRGRASVRRPANSGRSSNSGKSGTSGKSGNSGKPGNSGRAASSRNMASTDLEDELKKYVFYINVKHIEPTYIEVFHNKKRPDETIRLNW